ncbi:MAG: type 4a pilus biogenesis protein PilO [Candidatus Omnitrophota bacterium]
MIDFKKVILDKIVTEKVRNLWDEKVKPLWDNEQSRMYIILGAMGFFILLYLLVVVIPSCSGFSRLSAKAKGIKSNIELVETRLGRLDKMKDRLGILREELEGYAKGLPEQKEIPEFLEDFSIIARESAVKISGITPSEQEEEKSGETKTDYYYELPVLITARGGYHQLGRFVSELEGGKRFVTVEELRIRQDKKTPRVHNIEMTLKTYVSTETKTE